MIRISLTDNRGFTWAREGPISFKGYVTDRKGRFLQGSEACRLFRGVDSDTGLKNLLGELDGAYTVIVRLGEDLLVGVDPMRMFSLYYAHHKGHWLICDSANELLGLIPGREINQGVLPEFLSAGFVMGRETLAMGVFKTRAGEILHFSPLAGKAKASCHHYFLPARFSQDGLPELQAELEQRLDDLCTRMLASLNGCTAVVPLSGGYDSRLIACMLKKRGYEKVICFTYGKPGRESAISRRVARQLGYPWLFIDYTGIPAKGLLEDPVFLEYADSMGNLASMPYLQEFFAARQLKERGLIPPESIFLPGHTGDYLAGSYVEKTLAQRRGRPDRLQRLLKGYFRFIPLSGSEKKRILERLKEWFESYDPPPAAVSPSHDVYTEDWDLKEKFSGFVFNSARVFPFFGYGFRLPLWDAGLRAFFRKIPYSCRSYKKLYDKVLEETYFRPLGVYEKNTGLKESPAKIRAQRLRELLRSLVPGSIRRKRLASRDFLCYGKFTGLMDKQLQKEGAKKTGAINSYNAIICRWYVYRLCAGNKNQVVRPLSRPNRQNPQ